MAFPRDPKSFQEKYKDIFLTRKAFDLIRQCISGLSVVSLLMFYSAYLDSIKYTATCLIFFIMSAVYSIYIVIYFLDNFDRTFFNETPRFSTKKRKGLIVVSVAYVLIYGVFVVSVKKVSKINNFSEHSVAGIQTKINSLSFTLKKAAGKHGSYKMHIILNR